MSSAFSHKKLHPSCVASKEIDEIQNTVTILLKYFSHIRDVLKLCIF